MALFVLPGGYVADDGSVHCEVEMEPLTGRDEDLLASMPPNASAASVITSLLSRCLKRLGSFETVTVRLVSDLLVGDREYLLVRLREMTFGPSVATVGRCVNPRCTKPMDISFSLVDFAPDRKPAATRFFTRRLSGLGDCEIEFRLPTGRDQELLAPVVHQNDAVAVNQLLVRCLRRVGGLTKLDETAVANWPDAAREEIAAEMERLAPNLTIELEPICPECRTCFSAALDFTSFFLDELRAHVRQFEQEVHCLAWYYHWSEQDILSLPRKKRQRYIDLVQGQIESFN